jgi:hypothetical protein
MGGTQISARPCEHCGKRMNVSLRYQPNTARCHVDVSCPYCRAPNTIEAPGTVDRPVVVTKDRDR